MKRIKNQAFRFKTWNSVWTWFCQTNRLLGGEVTTDRVGYKLQFMYETQCRERRWTFLSVPSAKSAVTRQRVSVSSRLIARDGFLLAEFPPWVFADNATPCTWPPRKTVKRSKVASEARDERRVQNQIDRLGRGLVDILQNAGHENAVTVTPVHSYWSFLVTPTFKKQLSALFFSSSRRGF